MSISISLRRIEEFKNRTVLCHEERTLFRTRMIETEIRTPHAEYPDMYT